MPPIRLLRKYTTAIDGFDLTDHFVGEVFQATEPVAAMLAREGWAEPVMDDSTPDEPATMQVGRHKKISL